MSKKYLYPLLSLILIYSFQNEQAIAKKITPINLTGQYSFGDYKTLGGTKSAGILSVKQIANNHIKFEIVGYKGPPSYHAGKASGDVFLNNGAGIYHHENPELPNCKISFGFFGNKVVVAETAYGFECGFGNNVSVEGTYTKFSNVFRKIEYP
ncbi:MAG: hypothetical protein U0354_14915 [Candidatus Sericytochromatia bacterium]